MAEGEAEEVAEGEAEEVDTQVIEGALGRAMAHLLGLGLGLEWELLGHLLGY